SVPVVRDQDDAGVAARGLRDEAGCSVGRAVVDDEDPVDEPGDASKRLRQERRLVQSRHHHRHAPAVEHDGRGSSRCVRGSGVTSYVVTGPQTSAAIRPSTRPMIAPMTTPERLLGPPEFVAAPGATTRGASMFWTAAICCLTEAWSFWSAVCWPVAALITRL